MLFDINLLKENADDVKKYREIQKQCESQGIFDRDIDQIDPNSFYPVTEDFKFIKKGPIFNIKKCVYMSILKHYTKKINKELTNLKVVGKENIKGIKGGAIITCNHVSKVDSFAVREAVKYDINYVANDYNNWKGILGDVGRHTGFIPISQKLDRKLMRKFNEALDYYIGKKHRKVLIYPEQSMWREEPRPRPLKDGAFHYAVKYNVPVIPTFITFTPKEQMIDDQNRQNLSDYTIHVLPPIYPNNKLEKKDNIAYMRDKNYQLWKETYEKFYNKPVEFHIESITK